MELDDLKTIQVFMNRVQLSGAEVQTWIKCWNALAMEIGRLSQQPPPTPPT